MEMFRWIDFNPSYLQGCNKKFAQSTNLKSHILTHAKQKSGRGSVSSPDSLLESGHNSLDGGVNGVSHVLGEPHLVQVEVANSDEQFIVYTE